ncbi:MAG: TrkA family potassium uptake protein [Negativicutes bacterium]|nr:TrkA family potassium uptake protein [Negativicutes bacterium]
MEGSKMKVIIIGGGLVGSYIAKLLLENGCAVMVIENHEAPLAKLKRMIPLECINSGSGIEPSVLEACGIASADVVVAVTGADETNLVAATIAKFEFNVARVIARVNNPQNAWLFTAEMGVDVGLNQADLMAHLVVEEIDLKHIMTLMKLNRGDYAIVQVTISEGSAAANRPIKELTLPENAVLIALNRGKDVIIPRGNTILKGGDELLAFTDKAAAAQINLLCASQK